MHRRLCSKSPHDEDPNSQDWLLSQGTAERGLRPALPGGQRLPTVHGLLLGSRGPVQAEGLVLHPGGPAGVKYSRHAAERP